MNMRFVSILALAATLGLAGTVHAQRVWYLAIDELRQGGGWTEEPTGGYDDGIPGTPFDGRYWWASGKDGVRRAYWKFDNNANCVGPEIPSESRLYVIETWVPPANASSYSVIEAVIDGYDTESVFRSPSTPWNGQHGTNKQWIQRNQGNQGNWAQTGPGPQAPDAGALPEPACNATGNGLHVWLKRGSVLFVKFDFDFPLLIGVSAIRITEIHEPVVGVCDPPTAGGPLDLRCAGNADPLLGAGADTGSSQDDDKFANAHDKMIARGDATLAADTYVQPCGDNLSPPPSSLPLTPVSQGLPPDGVYSVHAPEGRIDFKLRYDGLNAMKWNTGDSTGRYGRENVFVLNETAERDFIQKSYGDLYILSVKASGSNGELVVEAVYADDSSDIFVYKLYDWFGTDGDADSRAVGVDGLLRSSDPGVKGFQRVNKDGEASNGGNHDGAFLFLHTAQLNLAKQLKRLEFSVQPDERGFGGAINVVAVSLDSSICKDPVFDVVGGGLLGTGPDGAVDQRDFGVFQACVQATAEPGENFDPIICGCFDINADGVINDDDFAYFENCWTGAAPGVPVDPACDDPLP